jgi:hypothetical protein
MQKARTSLYALFMRNTAATTMVAVAITSNVASAQNPPATIPAYAPCSSNVNVLSLLPTLPGSPPNPNEDGDTQFLNAYTVEMQLIRRASNLPM